MILVILILVVLILVVVTLLEKFVVVVVAVVVAIIIAAAAVVVVVRFETASASVLAEVDGPQRQDVLAGGVLKEVLSRLLCIVPDHEAPQAVQPGALQHPDDLDLGPRPKEIQTWVYHLEIRLEKHSMTDCESR